MEINEAREVSKWLASMDLFTMQKFYFLNLVQSCEGDMDLAAIKSGLSRRTLYRYTGLYQINVKQIRSSAKARKLVEAMDASKSI